MPQNRTHFFAVADLLLGPWDSNPLTTNGRVHAGVFSKDGQTLFLASDASNEVIAMDPRTGFVLWRMSAVAQRTSWPSSISTIRRSRMC